ncbi:MAG: Kelch repeat-containing protein [bacterium]
MDLSKQSNQITARQGAGMCQLSKDEIIIVGGFNGKFLNDFYSITFD